MHDGRFKTLEEVIEHYNTGIHRSDTLDPNIAKHPDEGLRLSVSDKKALVAFLKTLTDKRSMTTWRSLLLARSPSAPTLVKTLGSHRTVPHFRVGV